MSTNPQWKSFQPPDINQDSAILDFKPLANNDGSIGKSNQYPFSNVGAHSPLSNNCFGGQEFSLSLEKSSSMSGSYSNGIYGPSGGGTSNSNGNNTSTSAIPINNRFPTIGTFSIDTPNLFNSSGDSNILTTGMYQTGDSPNASYDSSNGSFGTRETGIIEKLLHSYGFIQCCERQARLFFHFSQFSGNIEHLKIGDPVEFEMTYDRRTGKPIASSVSKIAPEVVMSEERVTGIVTTELRGEGSGGDTTGRITYENRGECFFLPYTKDDVEGNVTLRSGDKVSFQVATNSRGNLSACHVRLENPVHPVLYQGVVCSMKESFGFIERADVVKEIFFHFSEAKVKEELRLGDDVEFTIQTRNGKEVACNITRLPGGTVIFEDLKPDILKGQVLKPLDRGLIAHRQTDALPGRIRYRAPDHSEVEISFGDKDQRGDFTLRHGDWVEFQIATDRRDGLNRATHISVLDDSFNVSGEKRELGIICTLKDGFGFLQCADRDARVFFHFNEILDVDRIIDIGDEFEFTVVHQDSMTYALGNPHNQAHNSPHRQSAIRMKWLPRGTIQFEACIENDVDGIILKECPLMNWQQKGSPQKGANANFITMGNSEQQIETGLISYYINGTKRNIAYIARDCDPKNWPRQGDQIEFDINRIRRNKELLAVNIRVVESLDNSNGNKTIRNSINASPPPSAPNKIPLLTNTTTTNNSTNTYMGFVAALKDGFGFIEAVSHDKEIFFHYSNFDGDASTLELGQEVEYTLASNSAAGSGRNVSGIAGGTCSTAESVTCIEKGSIELAKVVNPDVTLEGTIVRPLRSANPDQIEYSGLIRLRRTDEQSILEKSNALVNADNSNNDDDEQLKTVINVDNSRSLSPIQSTDDIFEFGIMSLVNKRELLQLGDHVKFQVDETNRAINVVALREKLRATVDAIKGHFGFLAYEVEEGKKLFFHMTEVKDNATLQVGDLVEFSLVTNQRNGKSSACSVTKISDGHTRPDRLISRLRTISVDDAGPKLTVVRQPKGPDGSKGFASDARKLRVAGGVINE